MPAFFHSFFFPFFFVFPPFSVFYLNISFFSCLTFVTTFISLSRFPISLAFFRSAFIHLYHYRLSSKLSFTLFLFLSFPLLYLHPTYHVICFFYTVQQVFSEQHSLPLPYRSPPLQPTSHPPSPCQYCFAHCKNLFPSPQTFFLSPPPHLIFPPTIPYIYKT